MRIYFKTFQEQGDFVFFFLKKKLGGGDVNPRHPSGLVLLVTHEKLEKITERDVLTF